MGEKEIDGAVDKIVFYVNGRKVATKFLLCVAIIKCYITYMQVMLQSPDPEMTLLYFLRNHCKLKHI